MIRYEGVTLQWWDHSLSEQLFVRKLHFTEKGIGGYCFNPVDGWLKIWESLADAVRQDGGQVRLNSPVVDIFIQPGKVLGVEVQAQPPIMVTDYPETEIIEAPCVISTLGCWDVLDTVDETLLPGWYVDRIKYMGKDELRAIWLGLYAALPEPVSVVAEREMPGWFVGPHSGLTGLCSTLTPYDPNLSPPGEYLLVAQLLKNWSADSARERKRVAGERMLLSIEEASEYDHVELTTYLKSVTSDEFVQNYYANLARWQFVNNDPLMQRLSTDIIRFMKNQYPHFEEILEWYFFTGDCVKQWDVGTNGAAHGAVLCANALTGRDYLKLLPPFWR